VYDVTTISTVHLFCHSVSYARLAIAFFGVAWGVCLVYVGGIGSAERCLNSSCSYVEDWSTWTTHATAVTASRRRRRCLSVCLSVCSSVRLSVVCHVLARNLRTQSRNSNNDNVTITARPVLKDLRSTYLAHKSLSHKLKVTDGRLEMPIPCLSINLTSRLRFDGSWKAYVTT